ncbi:AsnC family transcriptional regulator [Nocardia abscessus]|uniref:AsnC family transcriptional regulator n=1 Tax=Nocardia abscessus TaxID=120957 RepID=UPI0024558380|nr:AsnC family transcriptional regulator [Nocardia abscessus]
MTDDDRSSGAAGDRNELDDLLSRQVSAETVEVPLSRLRLGLSPRKDGESEAHVKTLAETADRWPPIVVHRSTMRVVDGAHRLRAAEWRGDATIRVRFFEGREIDAFVLAVKGNVAHGLPLTRAERLAAAGRIIESHPQWSDRLVASASGVSPRTVATLRSSTGDEQQLNARHGRDGKIRPLHSAEARLRAKELLESDGSRSLREIAEQVGLSPATVADVRRRLACGENAVPDGARPRRSHGPSRDLVDYGRVVGLLQRDPALRASQLGRTLLPVLSLDLSDLSARDSVLGRLPAHTVMLIAKAAGGWAQVWKNLAEELAADVDQVPPGIRGGT